MNRNEVLGVIQKFITDNPNKQPHEIIKLIDKKGNTGRTPSTIKKEFYNVKKGVTTTLKEEQPKWQVLGETYMWVTGRGPINLPVDFIDQLFYEYSEHGLNLSQTEIINKHNLKVWEWNSIKNTLLLFKKSNIFSPHTVNITPTDQMDAMIQEKIGKMLSNVGQRVVQTYNKELSKAYRKAVLEIEEWNVRKQIVLTELADIVPQVTIDSKLTIRVQKDSVGSLSVFIADTHFGAESRTKSIAPYSPEITEKQFTQIAEEINKHNAEEVHLFFVGDNIESATGLNHIDSWKGLAKGYYGSQLIVKAYQAYVRFISQVNNVKRIYAVPGNHDRMTERPEADSHGFMAEILFELIRLAFQDKIPVVYEEKVISQLVDNINIIMTHGHLKLTNIPAAELILEYGQQNFFNVLVSGHWHSRKVYKDSRNFRQIVCPSVFPGNDYSENLGVSALPGFLIIKSHQGRPYVIDCPLT